MLYFITILVAGIYFIPIGIYVGWKLLQYKIWLDHTIHFDNMRELNALINMARKYKDMKNEKPR